MEGLSQEFKRVRKGDLCIMLLSISAAILVITLIILTGLEKDNKIVDIMMSNGITYQSEISRIMSLSYQFGNLFLRAAIIILESILIATLLVDEFASKTIIQLFSLHISRGKIIMNKILAITSITILVHFLLQILFVGGLMFVEKTNGLTTIFTPNFFFKTFADILLISIIGLIPVVFGMIKYSKIAAILTGVFLAAILCSLNPGSLRDSFINNTMILAIVAFIVVDVVLIFFRAKINKEVE
ncbi:MAG: hypothetical protein ACRCX8_08840 [Sarcina sp.]